MAKFIISLFCIFILFIVETKSQTLNTDFASAANTLIKNDSAHLPKIKISLTVDSFSASTSSINLYFNIQSAHKKGDLPADYIEMLPEILMPLTTHYLNDVQLLLFAKEAVTNEWKTLNYFGNLSKAPTYNPIQNNDPYPAKAGKNNAVLNRVFPTTGSPTPQGALAGKTVWLSPGHGWHNTGSGFVTQRGTTNAIVEDFVSAESVDYYLMGYLYNAGANVWSVRERDVNINEIIIDNDVPASGYSETGSWSNGSVAGYGGTYRVANSDATETATASFVPNLTQSGLYWVSVRCIAGVNRATDVSFTIIHSGDTSVVKVNQEIHGETWVYLGQFYFTASSPNKIILSNISLETGQAIIADAVRLGGGIGTTIDCLNTGQPASNRARFEESARQYAIYQGHPVCIEDVTVRPKYAEYELQKGTASEINNAVFVSLHSNAGGGTGTETYTYNGLGAGRPNITAGSVDLRNFIHNQVVADIRALWKPTWADRGVKVANFGELRELNTIPGTLVELAFHDLAADATDLKHPEFRRIAARAIYKGILKFFSNRDGIIQTFLPEQPTNVIAKNIGSNNIEISWAAPISGGAYGDAATAYKLYVSTNGKSFKDGITSIGTSFTFNGNAQTIYYFKVTATNAGGESFSSSVVAAKTPATGNSSIPYLIVDAFDRLDGSALIARTESVALGSVRRMFLERMNRYDYMIEHAQALGNCNNNIAFDGCQNEAVTAGTVLLSTYTAVDWFTGEESTIDKSIDPAEVILLKAYLNAGGNLLISGAEIGWDIGRAASANVDADFFNNYLKALYVGDDATTYDFAGTTILFDAQTGTFDNSTNGYYDVDFPDRIAANGGGNIALNYSGGTADGAAVGYKGTFNVLYLAFPFEAITSAAVRNNLMCNAVAYLTPAIVPITGLTITGKNNAANNIINFTTLSEINTSHMLVERSENGIFFYQISPQILPKGSANIGAEYSFVDKSILPLGYYRIKVIDQDGKVSYSEIVVIKVQKTDKLFSIINNPANGNINIAMQNTKEAKIILSNAIGQIVYTTKIAGTLTFSIDVSSLAKGMYNVIVIANNKQQVEKVLVQ
jgi:N-acetylmuramoyl-L-alanine amidase